MSASLSYEHWQAAAKQLRPDGSMLVDGQRVPSAEGKTFPSINPASGATLADVASGTVEDVDRAVRAARSAFESGTWSHSSPAERKAKLLTLADLMMDNVEELALLDSMDTGKLIAQVHGIDVPAAANVVRWYAEAADKIYDEVAPTGRSELTLVTREPLGVIGAVIPWNFPLGMAAWKLAPALIAGNSIVLKPAEQSPLSALRLGELAMDAGIPPGVLNVVTGFGETAGQALGLHEDVDCVAFTGSSAIGKLFLRYAGESNMKQIWLECGGKSPNLVFADVDDLDQAAQMAAAGIFFNQGEVCSANSRLIVDRSIKDQFVARVVQRAEEIHPGDPLDPASTMGALIDEAHTKRVVEYIEHGKEHSRLITGGTRLSIGGGSCFVEPTIFDDVDVNDRLACEEIFGPVLAVIGFEDEEDAVRIANDSQFGLAASVWTSNLSRAHRLARSLHVGTVSVNTVDALGVQAPFGGFKQSGVGRDLSLHAIDKYTGLKTTWVKLNTEP